MNLLAGLCVVALLGVGVPAAAAQPGADAPRKRCGWFDNPSPGNVWLTDREAEWTVGMQGGHQAEGSWPTFKPRQWVRTGGSYGHGCACLVVIADASTREVARIASAYSLPLSVCRRDRALPRRPT